MPTKNAKKNYMYQELYQGCTFHCLVKATIKISKLQKFLRASEHFLSGMDLKGWKSCSLVGMQVVNYMQVTPAYDQHNTVILRMAAPLPNRPLHHYCEKTTYKAIRQLDAGVHRIIVRRMLNTIKRDVADVIFLLFCPE